MSIAPANFRATSRQAAADADRSDFGVPRWATELLDRTGAAAGDDADQLRDVQLRHSPAFCLVTVRRRDAAALDPQAFESCTKGAYADIAKRLGALPSNAARHPVRFWNYIPEIHRPCGENLDRYMCFNAGRFAACSEWFGGPDAFARLLATGSGVGHDGPDLVIHALAAAAPGVAVENPRQIPAYRYSRRFGPRPPCFARATVLRSDDSTGDAPLLLVGGTASIRGEESVHVGDLRAQTLETFENLASLVRSASAAGARATDLAAFCDVRVYHFRQQDRDAIARLVEDAFPPTTRVEYRRAALCRPELGVEIEGVAELR